jgi:hypothetical protein
MGLIVLGGVHQPWTIYDREGLCSSLSRNGQLAGGIVVLGILLLAVSSSRAPLRLAKRQRTELAESCKRKAAYASM